MNRNSLGVVSGAGAGAERSGAERSELQRSAAPVPAEAQPATSHPDREVVARPQRRSYPAEYKVRILREAEAAAAIRGGIGALLGTPARAFSRIATTALPWPSRITEMGVRSPKSDEGCSTRRERFRACPTCRIG